MINIYKKDKYSAMDGTLGFGLGVFASYLMQLFVMFAAVGFLVFTGKDVDFDTVMTDPLNFVGMAMMQLGFIAVFFLISRRVRFSKALGMDKKPAWYEIAAVFALSIVFLYLLSSPAIVFDFALQAVGYVPGDLGITFDTPGDLVGGIIVVCIMAPIGEELIFRGLLLSGIRNIYSDTAAVLLSALAFMLMHSNPDQTVFQFLLGAGLGFLFVRTGKIWLPMILHCLNNSFSLLFEYVPEAFFVPDFYASMHWAAATAIYLVIGLAGAAAVFGIFFAMDKLKKRAAVTAGETAEEGGIKSLIVKERRFAPNFIFFMTAGICFLMWIWLFVTRLAV